MNKVIYRVLGVFLFTALLHTPSYAQKGKPETDEQRTARCPEGQYAGPYEGARRFYQDPYVWFVSPEFARRFCMPESYIDESLKGALALAVRLKPEEFTLCGFVGGPGSCPPKQKLLIDVYIDNRTVTLPKADPTVKYYTTRVENSGWLMGTGNARSDRRRKGEITEVEGERRPFSPIGKERKTWVKFEYLAVRDGIADSVNEFIEDFYRANWVNGIDLITLDAYNFGYASHRDPKNPVSKPGNEDIYPQKALDRTNPIRGWAIGIAWGAEFDRLGKRAHMNTQYAIPYPQGLLHIIELPLKVVEIIYGFDHKQGEIFFNSAKNAIQSGVVPSK